MSSLASSYFLKPCVLKTGHANNGDLAGSHRPLPLMEWSIAGAKKLLYCSSYKYLVLPTSSYTQGFKLHDE